MEAHPKTMKAAVLVRQKEPLAIERIEIPQTLDVGQVLVKVHFSGICGSQLGEIDGVKGEDRFLPHLLGHEGSGEVIATGPGIRHVQPGNKVVLHWRPGLGIESQPPTYRLGDQTINAGWVTTFNEYAVVSENRMTAIPDDSDMDVAALFGCAVTTGFGVVVNNARVKIGESVVVFGAGGVGLSMVQAAAMVSAYPVIAVDLYDEKLKMARQMGASHGINARKSDVAAAIREILGEAPLDVFIDNTGDPGVIATGFALTSARGRTILVGVPKKGNDITIHSLPLHFGKELTGSHGGEAVPHEDIPRYQGLYAKGRLKLKELITHTFDIDHINEAIEGMRDGTISGRCLIKL